MDSRFIIKNLKAKFNHNLININESFLYPEESDFLTITRDCFTHELEVKISRSDFKADFKKRKHERISRLVQGDEYSVHRGEEVNATCNVENLIQYSLMYPNRPRHYNKSKLIREWYCNVSIQNTNPKGLPNKFSFICPEGLINRKELHPHYGLYWVNELGSIKEIKRAKFIHKEKFDNWKYLAVKLYNQSK